MTQQLPTPASLREVWQSKTTPHDVVGFFGHTKGPYRTFSNFHPCTLQYSFPLELMWEENKDWFPKTPTKHYTTEQAIMRCKALYFADRKRFDQLETIRNPLDAKKIGRLVGNFDDDWWNEVVCLIALSVVEQKFTQNPHMADILLSTGDSLIAETAPHDPNWGIALKESDPRVSTPSQWRGTNILGWALMRVRATLRHERT